MGFVDELRSRNGSSNGQSYFGQPSPDESTPYDTANSMMPLFHQIRNRNLEDFKAKSRITGDESIRQDTARRMLAPQSSSGMGGNTDGSPNVIYQPPVQDPRQMSAFQNANIGLEREKLAANRGNMSEDNRLNEQKFGLERQKSDLLNTSKQAELMQKAQDAEAKLAFAHEQLQARQGDAAALRAMHEAELNALNARHAADLAQRTSAQNTTEQRLSGTQKQNPSQFGELTSESTVDDQGNRTAKAVRKGGQSVNPFATDRNPLAKEGSPREDHTQPREGHYRVWDSQTGEHGDWPIGMPLDSRYVKIR